MVAKLASLSSPSRAVRGKLQAALYYARERRKGRYAANMQLNLIRTEGDSFMDGAYVRGLGLTIGDLLPPSWSVVNTAVGGSTATGIFDRINLAANKYLVNQTTVIWDGSENGITSVEGYVDDLENCINRLGHDRFLILPPGNPYGNTYAGSEQQQIFEEMLTRPWADHIVDWKDFFNCDVYGEPNADMYYNPGVDNIHMSALAVARMAIAITQELRTRGWISSASEDDLMLVRGSMWLFDPTVTPIQGVPSSDEELFVNPAWELALDVIGSGDQDSLATKIVLQHSDDDMMVERSSGGGIHVICTQGTAYTPSNQKGLQVGPNTDIQQYLYDNTDDDWYFSVWFKPTRGCASSGPNGSNAAKQSLMNMADNTSNYLFFMQDTVPSINGNVLGTVQLPDSSGFAENVDIPIIRAIGISGYTGTKPAFGDLYRQMHVTIGSADAWDYFNNGAAPSGIVYRAYAENLTVSGRTFDQVATIDKILWTEAFGAGGRFDDTYDTLPADGFWETTGAVVGVLGSGGQFPNSIQSPGGTGLTYEILDRHLYQGLPSVNIHISGTNNGGGAVYPAFETTPSLSASPGDHYEISMYGMLTNVISVSNQPINVMLQSRLNGGYVADSRDIFPTDWEKITLDHTIQSGANQATGFSLVNEVQPGETVNFTVRVGGIKFGEV